MRNVLARLRRAEAKAASLPPAHRVNAALYAFALLGLGLIALELRQGEPTTREVQSLPRLPATSAPPAPPGPPKVEPGAQRPQEASAPASAPATDVATPGGSGSVVAAGAGGRDSGPADSDMATTGPAGPSAAGPSPAPLGFSAGPAATDDVPLGDGAFEQPGSLIPPDRTSRRSRHRGSARRPGPGLHSADVTPADPVLAQPRPVPDPVLAEPAPAEPAAPRPAATPNL